jgi:ATP-dependent 26S proteasome regulatory subunit
MKIKNKNITQIKDGKTEIIVSPNNKRKRTINSEINKINLVKSNSPNSNIKIDKNMLCDSLDNLYHQTNKSVSSLCDVQKLVSHISNDYNDNFKAYYHHINKNRCGYNGDELDAELIQKIFINKDVNCLTDMIAIINQYPYVNGVEYNIDLLTLHKIKEDLIKMDSMIGMKSLKKNIVNQILYYIQNLHSFDTNNGDFMHVVLYGPPGTGKTEIAKIIGGIFSKMKILSKETFRKVTRADLIAGYLGQTALKTREVIKNSLGGVLFIDEAYSLGHPDKVDSFAKECIDILCEALSDHKDNLMVIIAGYEDELERCFFNYNPGMRSRFIWRYKIDEYDCEELMQIFFKKVSDANWTKDDLIKVKWFEVNMKYFKYFGRSIETLFTKAKIAHGRRVFGKDNVVKKQITQEDLDEALTMVNLGKGDEEEEDKTYQRMFL